MMSLVVGVYDNRGGGCEREPIAEHESMCQAEMTQRGHVVHVL